MKKLSLTMLVSLFLSLSCLQAYADSSSEANLKIGKAYMKENTKNPKVVTLPSGLQYEVLVEGKGDKPKQSDTVTVDYEGKLVNGKVFDSSYARGEPISFPVGGVIAGWQEALKLMNTGSTWMLYIPPSLAYGKQGAGGMIGPNETLIFKVHLIGIEK
ncbi:MAG: FKBP-type peptidyl-prolyl cis-trans isomerase [Gammaproteobacteria bacterium]|jgi:FKBP-type peptidyl-prolyl cis-trans isomerase FklB|nr:FKBP-type peptidyl-prolyl cis-trans isomerase [Gammaproteobacteria bacterium]